MFFIDFGPSITAKTLMLPSFIRWRLNMKAEIKRGLFTSTQVSVLTGVNVQTLREWQRKEYLPIPDTGGWQRYRFGDLFMVAAFKAILATGVTHEMAVEIAKFSFPIFCQGTQDKSDDPAIPYLLVSMRPNETPAFSLADHLENLPDALMETFSRRTSSGGPETYVTRFIIDFKDVYGAVLRQLNNHTLNDHGKLFWRTEIGMGE